MLTFDQHARLTSANTRFLLLLTALALFLFSCKKEDVLTAPIEEAEASSINITSISLSQGSAGDELQIECEGFPSTLSELTVLVDTARASISGRQPGKITIVLPELTPGTKRVKIKAGGQTSNSREIIYVTLSGEAGNSGYYLSGGNVDLHYLATTNGETNAYITSLSGIADSAGGKLYRLTTQLPGTPSVKGGVLTNSNHTLFLSYLDGAMAELAATFKNDPDISGFVLEGLPFSITMPARPVQNDAVTFSAPIRMAWTARAGDISLPFEMIHTYSNGKIIGFEDLHTPAGDFLNCLKWSYTTRMETKGPGLTQVSEEQHTLWYAKGLGLVKDVTTGTSGTTTTLLMEVKNK